MNRLLDIKREKCIMHLTKVLLPLFNFFKSAKRLITSALHSISPMRNQLADSQQVTCFSVDKVFFIKYLLFSNFGSMKLHRNTKTFLIPPKEKKTFFLRSYLCIFWREFRGELLFNKINTELIKISINNNNNLN